MGGVNLRSTAILTLTTNFVENESELFDADLGDQVWPWNLKFTGDVGLTETA